MSVSITLFGVCQMTTLNCCWTHWFTENDDLIWLLTIPQIPLILAYIAASVSVSLWIWWYKGKKWEIHRTLKAAGPPVRQWCVLNREKVSEETDCIFVSLIRTLCWEKDLWESYCITHCWRPVTLPAHCVCVYMPCRAAQYIVFYHHCSVKLCNKHKTAILHSGFSARLELVEREY